MTDPDPLIEAVERLERVDARAGSSRLRRPWTLTRRAALTGGGAGLAALLLDACGRSSHRVSDSAGAGVFGPGPRYQFVFVNHLTSDPFFLPTQYGAADACRLLGCTYQWTGSQTGNLAEMVNSLNGAVTAGADGIAVSLIDPLAFNEPVAAALAADIPVLSYNADVLGNPRLAFVGPGGTAAGQALGAHIRSLVSAGDVALFIATPGAANLQPRIDGALQALAGTAITPHVVPTGLTVPAELSKVDAYWVAHPNTRGLFAVDAGSTQAVAQVMQKYSLRGQGIKAGGFDLTPLTLSMLAAGELDFTVDQQPYLQGFVPVMQLYQYLMSRTLVGPADTDTVKFVDQQNVGAYTSKSRFEGTSTSPGVQA